MPPPNSNLQTATATLSFYRTIDRVENFKIRVKLAKIADANVPLGDEFVGSDPSVTVLAKKRRRALLPKPEVAVFAWGERAYSPSEVLKYHYQPSPNPTPQEKEHHVRIEQLIARPNSEEAKIIGAGRTKGARKQLFTYTSEDGYRPADTFTTSPHETALSPAEVAPAMRRPTQLRKRHRAWNVQDIVTDQPVPRNQKCGWDEMHIMAYFDIDRPTSKPNKSNENLLPYDEGVERCLCTIRAYDSGLISITPGLNTGKKPHRLTIGPNIYEYTIKNASKAMTEAEVEAEWSIFQELYKQQRTSLENLVSTTFTPLPPPSHARLHITGQIVSGERFRSTDIYIRYVLSLPQGWTTDDEHAGSQAQALASTTQVARATYRQGVGKSGFGYPLEWVVMKRDKPKEWPTLYITVHSVDSWDRHRVEGYGYIPIPREHGHYEFNISTWRPIGDLKTRLREFFLGGSPELEDLSYITIPGGSGKIVNKFGCRVESSGSVKIRLDVVQQADIYQVKAVGKDSNVHFGKGDIQAISDALARARARVKALQETRKAQ
ncbi:ciliary basal body-associated, B9 protein-domain-containing protein [Powellomyces hirtus]|nr:ciliary basal body-associated, B9 protein-domain-containing protein [Powellomyces hirtus]